MDPTVLQASTADRSSTLAPRVRWLMIACTLWTLTGCQQWPGNQAMRQYQIESERLLSEYRSQKKRAEDLEQRNVQLERRLGESEREIARLQGRNPNSRIASGNPSRSNLDSSDNPSFDRINGGGLPDTRPGPAGRLSSVPGDAARNNQWRPIAGR